MAKHSVYFDPYHEVILKHMSKKSNISKVISTALDTHFKTSWKSLTKEEWESLVDDLAKRSFSINASNIPLAVLRESVIKCLHQKQMKQPPTP